jgi:hypothetical protein
MHRRAFLTSAGASAMLPAHTARAQSRAQIPRTLDTGPMELIGDWADTPKEAALAVVWRMRYVSLRGVALLSDRQPRALRVERRMSGPPMIWLHPDNQPIGWIVVDVSPANWAQLAYEFGHELGHVLCNSWEPDGHAHTPCQWIEEALVEAFSLHNLGGLIESWARFPPFPGSENYAPAVRRWRDRVLANYEREAAQHGAGLGPGAWFRGRREALDAAMGAPGPASEAVPMIVTEMNAASAAIEALGALNRWPERISLPLEEWLAAWLRSCAELGASPDLPRWIEQRLLG